MIGSQAIQGQYPDAPEALLVSQEADIYAPARPDLSDEIDGALGQGSRFDRTFGYYADGVEPTTATLPKGWDRCSLAPAFASVRRCAGQAGLRARRWPGRSSPPSTTAFFFVELSSRCAAASAPRRSTSRG